MKSILLSIKPKWCAKIMNGDKTIEVRKNKALYKATMKLIKEQGYATFYMYCTKDREILYKTFALQYDVSLKSGLDEDEWNYLNGKVVAKFTVRKAEEIPSRKFNVYYFPYTETLDDFELLTKSCLTTEEFDDYLGYDKNGYAYHIEDLVIFDKPKELSDFMPIKWDKCGVKDKNGLYQCDKCPYGEVLPYGSECHYKSLKRPPQKYGSRAIYNKLGQLEDIEEEYAIQDTTDLRRRLDLADKYGELSEQLGIDLITLFKVLKNGCYGIQNGKVYKMKIVRIDSDELNSIILFRNASYGGECYLLKDYGKTWALTKEELE